MVDREDGGRLGKYELIAELPQDDWGDVYLAATVAPAGFSKLAVIKALRPTFASDAAFVSSFLDGARSGLQLNHANIIETHEVGEDNGRPFVAMEYLEGQTLARVIDRVGPGELPRAMWLRVLVDVLAGLHHAHEALDEGGASLHLAHLRLGPRRVFVTYDGQVKLLDFGGRELRGDGEPADSLAPRARYVAPEQARGESLDRRADLFAVGMMVWEAITRVPPWGDLDDRAVLGELAAGRIPSLRKLDPEVPKPLADIVRRALAPVADDRYSTAMHFQTDLEGFLRASGESPTPREIGRVVAQAFLDERLRATTVIDEQLRRLRARAFSSHGSEEMVSLLKLEAAQSSARRPTEGSRALPTTPRAFPVPDRVPARHPSRRIALLASGAALIAGGLILAALALAR